MKVQLLRIRDSEYVVVGSTSAVNEIFVLVVERLVSFCFDKYCYEGGGL